MSKKRHQHKNKDYISIYGINGALEILHSKFTIIGIDFLENSKATKNSKLMNLVKKRKRR